MSRRISRGSTVGCEEPQVNITPLIDVVFVILIMFILIAPLLEMERIELAEGAAIANEKIASVREESPIFIEVFANDHIEVNKRAVAVEELAALLREEKALHPEVTPQLCTDKKASFGTYQAVKNCAELAGFSELELILLPGAK